MYSEAGPTSGTPAHNSRPASLQCCIVGYRCPPGEHQGGEGFAGLQPVQIGMFKKQIFFLDMIYHRRP